MHENYTNGKQHGFFSYSTRLQFPLFPDNSQFMNILNNFGQLSGLYAYKIRVAYLFCN